MRVRINAEPVGPLSVLPELPDAPLALLEGLNGIGKTLAIRILQLCTGEQPYRPDSASWQSLCEGLGPFQLSVANLRGAESIQWEANSHDWLEVESLAEGLPFRSIRVDGAKASLEDVRKILEVHRLAGDETLLETLAQQADLASTVVQRWNKRTWGAEDSPLPALEHLVAEIAQAIGGETANHITLLRQEARHAQSNVKSSRAALDETAKRAERLTKASDVHRRLQRLREISPDLRVRLEHVDQQIASTTHELKTLQPELRALAEKSAKTKPLLKELKNARSTAERNRSLLSSAVTRASGVAAELGIEANRSDYKTAVAEIQEEIQALEQEHLSMDAVPAMRELLSGIAGNLEEAEVRGLGDEVALKCPELHEPLTVAGTRAGMVARVKELEGEPQPPAARKLTERLSVAVHKRDRLANLKNALDDIDRYRRLTAKNEKRVDEALAKSDPESMAKLKELEARQRDLNDRLMSLAADRAALRQQLGNLEGQDEEYLSAQLSSLLTDLGTDLQGIHERLQTAKQEEEAAAVAHAQAKAAANKVDRELARLETEVAEAVSRFQPGGDLAWLGTEREPPAADSTTDRKVRFLNEVHTQLEGVADRLGEHRIQMGALEEALRGIARHLRGQELQTERYVSQLEEWFGRSFSKWFATGHIQAALLPSAQGGIEVDVRDREVHWTTDTGRRSKPLESFSSGEQAFAYTRARLAVLDEQERRGRNRLIVLDEFGAFIAQDRLADLLDYLQERVAAFPDDQVLVVLPVSHDYVAEAESSIGPRKKYLEDLASQLERQKYAVRTRF